MFIWISFLRIDLKTIPNSSAIFERILTGKDGALTVRCTLRMRFCASYTSSKNIWYPATSLPHLLYGRLANIMFRSACLKLLVKLRFEVLTTLQNLVAVTW